MKEKPFKRFWKRWWIFKTHTNANAEFPHEAAHNRICVSILSIRFMISRKILCCWLFKRAKRQTTPWTMSWKLTLKQPRWSNSTTGRRKNMYFWLILVNCPFKEWNVRKIQCRSSMEKRRPTAQRWNTEVQQMLKMILYICTKVSALRNISGKSWVTIHPAHTETIRNTHSEKVQSQMWRGMRKCFTDVQVIVKCCSGDLTSRLNVCVCCRWERQKDKILERGRPIRIQGSAADCPQRAKTVPEPFFFFFCTGASVAHLHSQKILASKKKKSQVFSFMIELCWRKQTAEWGVQQLWLNLFLLSVRRPQVNIGFALCAFFSTGSWAFSPSGSPGLQERRYRFLKKKIKVKKCIISSSWKPSCFLYPLVWRSVLDCCLL